MKVLVVGSGGREHAIVWKLSRSKHVQKVYCCPGNVGIAEIAECIDILPSDFSALVDFIKYQWIDLTIVGQEGLLVQGIVDFLMREGCRAFGPDRQSALMGCSRVQAKNFMRLHGIPTPEFRIFPSYSLAHDYVRMKGAPLVIKTDNPLLEGGMQTAHTVDSALEALKKIMKHQVSADSGREVVVEEYIEGDRMSFLFLYDGNTMKPVSSMKKFLYMGPEKTAYALCTGAYSPLNRGKHDTSEQIEKIMKLFLGAFQVEGLHFRGFLSMDMIVKNTKLYVEGFSTFLGDVEGQTMLPRLKTDFIDIAAMVRDEKLAESQVDLTNETALCLIAFAEGYPDDYRIGQKIKGLESLKAAKNIFLFHNNTSFHDSDIVSAGGRVLGIAALGSNLREARESVYRTLREVSFEGMVYLETINQPGPVDFRQM